MPRTIVTESHVHFVHDCTYPPCVALNAEFKASLSDEAIAAAEGELLFAATGIPKSKRNALGYP